MLITAQQRGEYRKCSLLNDGSAEGLLRDSPAEAQILYGLRDIDRIAFGQMVSIQRQYDKIGFESMEVGSRIEKFLLVHAVVAFVDIKPQLAADARDSNSRNQMLKSGRTKQRHAQGQNAGRRHRRIELLGNAIELAGLDEIDPAVRERDQLLPGCPIGRMRGQFAERFCPIGPGGKPC